MAKKKPKKNPRELKKSYIFFLGILVGIAIFWLPSDFDFSPTQFTSSPFAKTQSVFEKHLPITSPIIKHEGHIISYNGSTRNPNWVYHKLTEEIFSKNTSRQDCEFKEDPLLPAHIAATREDYTRSGYDRGHLCAAADCISQQAVEDSFFMTNVVPQDPTLNRGFWKRLENHVRDLTKQYRMVHIFSGPLYLSAKGSNGKRHVKYQVLGKNYVAVPTHFFMLIFVELPSNKMLNKGFIVPNKAIKADTSFRKYSATIQEIEIASGILFTNVLE